MISFSRCQDHLPFERRFEYYRASSILDPTARMQYADTCTDLTDDILVKVDKASMLNSLETRAPLLIIVWQNMASLNPALASTMDVFMKDMANIAEESCAGLLPADILERPKRGFSVPISSWSARICIAMLMKYSVQRKHEDVVSLATKLLMILRTDGASTLTNHSQALWTLLCLELWFQTCDMDPQTEQTRSAHSSPYTIQAP